MRMGRGPRTLALCLQVLAAFVVEVYRQQLGENILNCKGLGVIGAVAADLSEGPGCSRLDVVFGLAHECVEQRSHALGHDDAHRQRLAEGGNVAESHDTCKLTRQPQCEATRSRARERPGLKGHTRQTCVALGVVDVVY